MEKEEHFNFLSLMFDGWRCPPFEQVSLFCFVASRRKYFLDDDVYLNTITFPSVCLGSCAASCRANAGLEKMEQLRSLVVLVRTKFIEKLFPPCHVN